MSDAHALAALLFQHREPLLTPEDYERMYPPRPLPAGAKVVRFAPSPTGFMHLGGVYISLINHRIARQSGGVFFLRIEDTDQERAIPGALETIINALRKFDILPDEGVFPDVHGQHHHVGDYGPYIQSHRAAIYQAYAKRLVEQGKAYPCFMTSQETEEIRRQQTLQRAKPGMYGNWTKWRWKSFEDVVAALEQKLPFTIRLRNDGDDSRRISWDDGCKGKVSMPEYDLDVVILKQDGIPTYHFAHLIDDHLMRTTHVIRADEWVSSVPLHLQLFQLMGWEPPRFCHVSAIQKMDAQTTLDKKGVEQTKESRRKLSKRKDPEANVDFYEEQGFPVEAIIDYLMNLANADFEEWRNQHPTASAFEFPLVLEKIPPAGPLTDLKKLENISRETIFRFSLERTYQDGLAWAKRWDAALATEMERDPAYTTQILNIEREGEKPSKRLTTWRDLRPQLGPFYDRFALENNRWEFPEQLSDADIRSGLMRLVTAYDPADDKDTWFNKVKAIAEELGYAAKPKDYKQNPTAYKGHIGDVTMLLRVALFGSRRSPDLWESQRVLGIERVRARISRLLRTEPLPRTSPDEPAQ